MFDDVKHELDGQLVIVAIVSRQHHGRDEEDVFCIESMEAAIEMLFTLISGQAGWCVC